MQIGEVIRKYRKEKKMTQEAMARQLGVTAPAVNKWENGNSTPDISLLAPIARLLDISLDTLLSFQEELTEAEVKRLVNEADERFRRESYDEVFAWAKKQMELYPNCERLTLWMAQLLDAQCLMRELPDAEDYNEYIIGCYLRILKSEDEELRRTAADALYSYYLRQKQYEKAEGYLAYFSKEDPQRKFKQAVIYHETGQTEEAYQAYESLLFTSHNLLSQVFNGLYLLAMEEGNYEKACMLVKKQQELERLFEMGRYSEVSVGLDLAAASEDSENTLRIMREMLDHADEIGAFRKSPLSAHMEFSEMREDFVRWLREELLQNFRDEKAFGFLKGDKRYEELVRQK